MGKLNQASNLLSHLVHVMPSMKFIFYIDSVDALFIVSGQCFFSLIICVIGEFTGYFLVVFPRKIPG